MKPFRNLVPAVLSAGLCVFQIGPWIAAAQAQDATKDTLVKTTKETIRGPISAMSKTEVKIGDQTVGVVEIDAIRYASEPSPLASARNQIKNGAYENALKSLDKVDAATVERAEIKQDLQYYRALANARLALGGGSVSVADAGRLMLAFVNENPDNYHLLPASAMLGDLFVAAQKYENAVQYYGALAASPFPKYKMQAGISTGRALLAQGKFDPALEQFESVLALESGNTDAEVDAQRQSALLGKATCLAEKGQADEGIKLVEEAILKLPPEESDLHAQAYVTLGNCYLKKSDSTKQALLAFLHVDVLYYSNTQAHAEALHNLARLWNETGKTERAIETAATLKERYPNSEWAKR